jgi:hypothetical protein
MVDHELIERVTRLPVSQRLELIELLTHSLREELAGSVPNATAADVEPSEVLGAVERLALSYQLDVPGDSSLHHILGVVPSDALPTTKGEVRDLITDYLIEKHS